MNAKQAIMVILGCVALAGCSTEDMEYFGIEEKCEVEEWYQVPGVEQTKGSTLVREGVIVKGVADCSSWSRISVRAYGRSGKLVGVGDDFINAGVFSVFVETHAVVENVDFRIEVRRE